MDNQQEKHTLQLLARINQLELEQKDAKERIQDLTITKIRFQDTLTKMRNEKDIIEEKQRNSELLQQKLNQIIEDKESEEETLRKRIEKMREETIHEITLLRAERDKAMRFANSQQDSIEINDVSNEYKALMFSAILITLAVGGFSLFWLLQ